MHHTARTMNLEGANVTLMGLGRFGGGAGAARWLLEQGASLTITDVRTEDDLRDTLDALDTSRVTLRLGGHEEADFTRADLVVVNPGVPRPWENRYVRAASEAGAVVTTEIRLAIERLPRGVRTMGVTGTTGKSTTSTMLAGALRAGFKHRPVHLAGNIGGSLLGALAGVRAGDVLVLELSSAQLWWLSQEPAWRPEIAVVTNFAPNHLDWHGTVEHYERCKRAIVGERLVCFRGPIESWGDGKIVGSIAPDEAITLQRELSVRGAHNAFNATLAITGAMFMLEHLGEGEKAQVRAYDAVINFRGLDHRLKTIGFARGVELVDDSKCTTPEGAALGVGAFAGRRIHLIAGGADKGVDLASLAEGAMACASVHCIGVTGPAIAGAINARGGAAHDSGDLASAVDAIAAIAEEGDVILLSPGCASWDQFTNYIERARAFRDHAERALGPLEPAPPAPEQKL